MIGNGVDDRTARKLKIACLWNGMDGSMARSGE